MYLIGICEYDDDYRKSAKKIIETFLKRRQKKSIVYEYRCEEELKNFDNQGYGLDFLFINTKIKNRTTIDIVREFKIKSPACQIVFWSESLQNIFRVYEVEHSFHIVMNRLEENIAVIFRCLFEKYQKLYKRKLIIEGKGRITVLDQMKIEYMERFKRNTLIYLNEEDDVISTSKNLDLLHMDVNRNHFVRCHNSYIVNLNYVVQYYRNMFVLSDGISIPISRKYYEDVRNVFLQWGNDMCCQILH